MKQSSMSNVARGHKLRISEIKCTGLPHKDAFSIKNFFRGDFTDRVFDRLVDPYVTFTVDGSDNIERTTTIQDTNDPSWKDEINLQLGRPVQFNDTLVVTVFDEENVGPDINIGEARAKLDGLARVTNEEHPSQDYKYKLFLKNRETEATVEFRVEYIQEDEEMVDGQNKNIDGFMKYEETAAKSRKHSYPDKVTNFKVYVKVHEACHLINLCGNPKIMVTVGGKTQTTRCESYTSSPKFNQVFWFDFQCKPNELFEKVICFEVFNVPNRNLFASGNLDETATKTTLVGVFKCNTGYVYDQPDHGLFRKWLVLSEPGDTYATSEFNDDSSYLAGYLKVTAVLFSARENIPRYIDDPRKLKLEEDSQANVAYFSDVTLQKLTLFVRVYHAEDLPQMDLTTFSLKDRCKVDAYLKVWFDGVHRRTKVCSSYRPEFNQELVFNIEFPSVCNVMRLELWDKDPGKDECIATTSIKISNISKPSKNSFLPHFGPAYVNFFGSFREYSLLNINNQGILNADKVEGLAYRGRVFLEIQSKYGEYNLASPVQDITPKERNDIVNFIKKKEYLLSCMFLNATMFDECDHSVKFEVSVGTYGNKLDSLSEPQSSCTPPSNPIYDGFRHYFIPWEENKPCCIVESSWEDVEYRMKFINYASYVMKEFEDEWKLFHYVGGISNDILKRASELLKKLRNDFIEFEIALNIEEKATEAFANKHGTQKKTKLDELLYDYRQRVLQQLTEDLRDMEKRLELASYSSDTNLHRSTAEAIPTFLYQLKMVIDDLCNEAQDGIPDVIITMIIGDDRKGYSRIPARKLLYSENTKFAGDQCRKLQNLLMAYPQTSKQKYDVPCCVSFIAYLGKSSYPESDWTNDKTYSCFAEVYETVNGFDKLSTTKITDMDGNVIQRVFTTMFNTSDWKHKIDKQQLLSYKWEWARDSDWTKVPHESAARDESVADVVWDEIYETQSRFPFKDWINIYYTNSFGDVIEDFAKNQPPPNGYKWMTTWSVDYPTPSACDDEGWQYAVDLRSASWSADCLFVHRCRRKRLIRKRVLQEGVEITQFSRRKMEDDGFWMYSTAFHEKFHEEKKIFDTVKRRKHQRRIQRKRIDAKKRVYPSRQESFSMITDHEKNVTSKKKKKLSRKQKTLPRVVTIHDGVFDENQESRLDQMQSQNDGTSVEEHKDEDKDRTSEKDCRYLLPTIYQKVTSNKWQLRIFIWQGCDLMAADVGGTSDPYIVATFLQYSSQTRTLWKTLNPTWDETLFFEEIKLDCDKEMYKNSPPNVVLELWDHDNAGKHDFLGRCIFKSQVILDYTTEEVNTKLIWHPIFRKGKQKGQLLANAQLIYLGNGVKEKLEKPPLYKNIVDDSSPVYQLPEEVRPKETKVDLKFSYFGVRRLKKSRLTRIKSPWVEMVIGGNVIHATNVFKQNATEKPQTLKIPCDSYYLPPVTVRVYDEYFYGKKVLIGKHILKDFNVKSFDNGNDFVIDMGEGNDTERKYSQRDVYLPSSDSDDEVQQVLDGPLLKAQLKKKRKEQTHLDWWCKYFASNGMPEKANGYLEKRHDPIEVYNKELEAVDEFVKATIFQKFKLFGKDEECVGELKGLINCVKPGSSYNNPGLKSVINVVNERYIVRVYVIRGINLRPSDFNGKADPYLTVTLGKEKKSSKENCIMNNLNPYFGECFQFEMSENAKDLTIKVKDFDRFDQNDLIGETTIDLEDRILWNKRLAVGLPKKYYKEGPFKWRDSKSPMYLLKKAVYGKYKVEGRFNSSTEFEVPGIFTRCLDTYEQGYVPLTFETRSKKKRLALYILNDKAYDLPIIKEHVETRTLWNELYPQEEQGKIDMFVEIFPKSEGIPGPLLDISPRKPREYVLRVVVYRTSKVLLQEKEFLSGKDMSDIYVKGWLKKEKKKQKTDVHYRSMSGEGLFNWRFVFPFKYIPEEKQIVFDRKDAFWHFDKTEQREKPMLRIECWDSDVFTLDDYLGFMELDLSRILRPKKSPKDCELPKVDVKNKHKNLASQKPKKKAKKKRHTNGMNSVENGEYDSLPLSDSEEERSQQEEAKRKEKEEEEKYVDLFQGPGKLRGWWLLTDEYFTKETGKIELEIEVVTAEEAEHRPAGKGREEPNMNPKLDEPDRPKTSFFWFTSPWKSFKYIIWQHNKWKILLAILLSLLLSLFVVWIYHMPEYAIAIGLKKP